MRLDERALRRGRRRRSRAGVDPPYHYPDYVGTRLRAPKEPLVIVPATLGPSSPAPRTASPPSRRPTPTSRGSTTASRSVSGSSSRAASSARDGRPLRGQLIEIWQANAAGRYRHAVDTHDAPLDPNFSGAGRCLTDDDGRYRFVTVKPGHLPWGNHPNAWRPAHIHFSLFGRAFTERLVTQMYFPDDPLFPFDPIFNADPRRGGASASRRARSTSSLTEPDWALGFRWDIVLGGRESTPLEEPHDD